MGLYHLLYYKMGGGKKELMHTESLKVVKSNDCIKWQSKHFQILILWRYMWQWSIDQNPLLFKFVMAPPQSSTLCVAYKIQNQYK